MDDRIINLFLSEKSMDDYDDDNDNDDNDNSDPRHRHPRLRFPHYDKEIVYLDTISAEGQEGVIFLVSVEGGQFCMKLVYFLLPRSCFINIPV